MGVRLWGSQVPRSMLADTDLDLYMLGSNLSRSREAEIRMRVLFNADVSSI